MSMMISPQNAVTRGLKMGSSGGIVQHSI